MLFSVGLTTPSLSVISPGETAGSGEHHDTEAAQLQAELDVIKAELQALTSGNTAEGEIEKASPDDDIVTSSPQNDGWPQHLLEEDASGDPYKALLQQQAKALHQVRFRTPLLSLRFALMCYFAPPRLASPRSIINCRLRYST